MNRLAVMAYTDPRYEQFADQRFAEPVFRNCTDSKHRFDPFNWDGKIPPDHAR
ncbi:hypothetical protein R69658_07849 [Paraburkholderia aspalathi]|uniref:Berberine and berberine like n=1 Tax=Paraburkholderia aspalathi TaxID=1324617 RepID=A0ABM8T866_9BURK|nr:hypothetical protein [Paraburkholderia aspalathi]MBK3824266.1 hypothetical protein [Paraburkholderia aspalathi]MBK3836112.1 hypothetical protein [Paraburkholderia aspalathi]MBK3844730.1 hypothetical protein [Paraburkholderia aspalathi]MBK3865880.1 hypothetical protein [Paraburkholderia aspalathi]CAE6865711.1 hypothetical protein R69658_07849 [Paraburkholderia aspalathi]